MASVHKQPGRPFWYCAFTNSDGRRLFRSTKTSDKRQACEICRAWDKTARLGKKGLLTPEAAREVIASGVADVFMVSNLEALPKATVRDWSLRWVEKKRIETESSTANRYRGIVERFLNFLGSKADRDISTLKSDEIAHFRDQEAKTLSRASANLSLKVLRVCFGEAVRQEMISTNPAGRVETLRNREDPKRRAFTAEEIRRILAACGNDIEWRGLVLFGLYTGQRLGDLARLTWRHLNLQAYELTLNTKKTGRLMVLPLAKPLRDYLSTLSSRGSPDGHIFQIAAKARRTSTLSNRFYEVLVNAGLVEPRARRIADPSRRKGRATGRAVSEVSFHSLRHSAVTFLKAAGVSNALAMGIVGHESTAISRGYTHLSTDDLRREIDKMPDVTVHETSPT